MRMKCRSRKRPLPRRLASVRLNQCLLRLVHPSRIALAGSVISRVRQQSFVLCLLAAVAVALVWPLPAHAEATRWAQLAAKVGVGLIFFLQGLSLATRQMLAGARPLRLHVFVLGWNFVLFPVLAVLFQTPGALLLGRELTMGFWMLAILPTTIASATALTAAARGAVPQALFASVFSNLLAIVLVPLLAVAYFTSAGGVEVSLMPVFAKLCWIVLLPLLLGQCLRRYYRERAMAISRRLRRVPQAAIVYIVYFSFAQTAASGVLDALSSRQVIGALLLVTLLLLLASWAVWRSSAWMHVPDDERVAAFYTASQKSLATGLPLLTAIFAAASVPIDAGLVLVPLLLYHSLQLFLGGVLAPRFAARVGAIP